MTHGANSEVAFKPRSLMDGKAAERVAPPWPARGPVRILIVDDNKIMRHSVSRLLSLEPGLAVVGEAVNGQQAVAFARVLRPDFVIMDVNMPLMDGIEATFLIMEEHPDIMVIGFSSLTENHIKIKMLKAGAVDLLDKSEATFRLAPAIHQLWAERVFANGAAEVKKASGA